MPRARRAMRRRRVVGTVATTAVVAGTAGAVHHHQNKRYANQAAAEQQQYAEQANPEDTYQEEAYDAPPAAPQSDLIAELERLGELHTSGVLTDDEFAAAKQKLLES